MLQAYLLIVGALILLAATISAVDRIRFSRRSIRAAGTLAAWVASSDNELATMAYFYMRVSFVDRAGKLREFTSSIGRAMPSPPVGTTIMVDYDPDLPSKATEATTVAKWGWPVALALTGIVSVVSALLLG